MRLLKKWLRQWRDYTGGQQLTLMGELTISSSDSAQLLELTQPERDVLAQCEKALQERFPYLEITRDERMVETTLRFFAYKHFIAEPQFLETFRELIAVTLHALNGSTRLCVRLMASGTLIDSRQKQKFSYLSKGDLVDYKITESRPCGKISVITRQRIKAYALVLIIALAVAYLLYLNLPKQQIHDFLLPTIDV